MADLLATELALDRVLGELAAELPAHVRAFARAHAGGHPPPPAPAVARAPATLALAAAAIERAETRARGWTLWRLVAPLVIEDDAQVAAVRGAPATWGGLAELAAARDAVARARFGTTAIAALHRAHGVDGLAATGVASEVASSANDGTVPAPIDGWHAHGVTADADTAWRTLAARLGVTGRVEVVRGEPPRAFAVEPGVSAIVVVPAVVDTPAARFAVLHELGHAVCALVLPAGTPRVLDEAVAARVARLCEPGSWLGEPWPCELAPAARARRSAIARVLDAVERELPAVPRTPPSRVPPRALWHDPGAQAAYVAAETLADRIPLISGQLGPMLAAVRDHIDAHA